MKRLFHIPPRLPRASHPSIESSPRLSFISILSLRLFHLFSCSLADPTHEPRKLDGARDEVAKHGGERARETLRGRNQLRSARVCAGSEMVPVCRQQTWRVLIFNLDLSRLSLPHRVIHPTLFLTYVFR